MITLKIRVGNTTITGPTFSIIDSRVDNVETIISNLNSLTEQLITIQMENESEQFVSHGTSNEDFSTGLSVSILLQSDNTTDISYDLNQHMGVKSVIVELIP